MEEISADEIPADERRALNDEFIATHQTLFQNTGNPAHVWIALHACLQEQRGQQAPRIPTWIADYLLEASRNLSDLMWGIDHRNRPTPETREDDDRYAAFLRKQRITPQRAMELVPAALGLSRAGWNACAAYRSWYRKLVDREELYELKHQGVSTAEAIEQIRKRRGLEDERAVRRRISEVTRAMGDRAEIEGETSG